MSAIKKFPFQIPSTWNAYPRNILARLLDQTDGFLTVFRRNRVIFYHRSKRNYRAFKWFSESPLIRCHPIGQEIKNVSQIAVTFHGIRPPMFVKTWLEQYRRCPFHYSTHCSLSNPICFWPVCVDLQWFQDNSSQDLPNSKESSV